MRAAVGPVVAALVGVLLLAFPHWTAAQEVARGVELSSSQVISIIKAFAAATPEVGVPQITPYPEGAYVARAQRGNVDVYVHRNADGDVIAQYTTTGPEAARGVASANNRGGGSSQMVFGPKGDRSAEHAASRLARTLSPVRR